MDLEHERRLADVEARSKSNTKRIDKLEKLTAAIDSLATSVALLAQKTDSMDGKLDTMSDKVEKIEEKPARRWNTLVDNIIWAVAAAGVTYILTQIGL